MKKSFENAGYVDVPTMTVAFASHEPVACVSGYYEDICSACVELTGSEAWPPDGE